MDAIWQRARAELVIVTEQGAEDVFLFEHSARVARSAELIAKLPSVREREPDLTAVVAAALFHEAGWIARLQDGEAQRVEIMTRPPSLTLREQSAIIMEERLRGSVSPSSINRASRAIRSLSDRSLNSVEGLVTAEADNLDEFGLLAYWPNIRRGTLDGKAVQAAIDTWHRRREYQFWTARIKDSFHFEEIRKLAERRLASYERAMSELEEQHKGLDVAMALGVDLPVTLGGSVT